MLTELQKVVDPDSGDGGQSIDLPRQWSHPYAEDIGCVDFWASLNILAKGQARSLRTVHSTIGTAPELGCINSLTPGIMAETDLPDVGLGSTLYLPVRTEGALFFLGDCHAVQGDGELWF